MLDGQRVGSRCEQAVAHSSEDLALDRGGVVCVQYVGSTTSENAEWLLGECPPGSINRGWFPAANMYPRDYTSIKIRWAINGEVLAIVELQTSDTLDALPLVVSTSIGEYTWSSVGPPDQASWPAWKAPANEGAAKIKRERVILHEQIEPKRIYVVDLDQNFSEATFKTLQKGT